MKIIDSHAHIFPQKIALKASRSIGKFYGKEMAHDGLPQTLLKSGEKIGVDKYLVCSTATRPEQVKDINNFIHEQCLNSSKFIGFATIHQDLEKPEEELERIVSMGFHGIKLHPDFQQLNIDEPKMIPVYKMIAKLKLPILFHTGDNRYDYSSPKRLHNLMQQVPELLCIAAHFGGYQQWDDVRHYLKDGNVIFDTSSTLAFVEKEYARALLYDLGVDRFLFGVDFPMWNHEDEFARFKALELPERDQKMILHENFERYILEAQFKVL